MSKNGTKANTTVRVTKAKTAAQIAERDRNIRLAEERRQRLAEKQRTIQRLRREGQKGTDEEIWQRELEAIYQRAQQQWEAESPAWVERVLSTPQVGGTIKRWLKERIEQPATEVRTLIKEFLSRDQNKVLKDFVDAHLERVAEADAKAEIDRKTAEFDAMLESAPISPSI